MCGIAGFAGIELPAEEARRRLGAMCHAIAHRGPDSDGYFLAPGAALGMRRLSIIDVAGGDQPISNEDGTVTVVFNGEIYNHHALRRELQRAGHRFSTRSDTEVLVHLYEEHGTDMVRRLHGMFAFSIWDSRRQRLFVARDRTGMKPLSYALRAGGIVFCSELRALYAFDRSALRVAPGAVMEYLAFGYVPDPNSIFEDVSKLPPGHFLVWTPGHELEVRRYWSPPLPDPTLRDEGELVQELSRRLEAAVTSHLESEVPLGAFLSGGTDSSTVVALMCRHAAGRVKTFSIGFAEAQYDESRTARAVAARLGTEHTELLVRPDVEQLFESIAAMFDEPFADSSAIPTFLVAQLARESVTVALSGDGGDELFGGYTRYGETLRRGGAGGAAAHVLGALGLMLPHAFPGRNRLVDLGRSRLGRYATSVVQPVRVDEGGVASDWHPAARRTIDEQLNRFLNASESDDFAALMMRLDLETYLPGDILTKVDRTSMAVSLEARVPLLDFDLVNFALAIPGNLRVTTDESKRLFRRAIRGMVPDFVLSGPKRGFAVPLAQWFRGSLRHRIEGLRNPSVALEQYLDMRAVERLIVEHSIGRRDHSFLLWRLIVLNYWLAAFADGRLGRPPLAPPSDTAEIRALPARLSRGSRSVPPAVSSPFLRSASPEPPLRVGLLVEEGAIPGFARGIIEDLSRANYVELAFVGVGSPVANHEGPSQERGIVLRAYSAFVESRYQLHPDPLEPMDCDDLLAAVPRLDWPPTAGANGAEIASAATTIAAAPLDVVIDVTARPIREPLVSARHGIWRYHFGDRRCYPLGSGFLREMIDGSPLTGIELVRLGVTAEDDVTLMRALFRTVPFPSRQANRFAPLWGSRHFVIQSLWSLKHGPVEAVAVEPKSLAGRRGRRMPTTAQFGRWMLGELGARTIPRFRRADRPLHWRIAIRQTRLPLYMDASRAALQSFRWIASPPDHHWADPAVCELNGGTWLFFEEIVDPSRVGHICCGRLTPDGVLVDVRPVLQQPHHLSFPQIICADGEVFLLPESAQGGGLDLYRAARFPDEWVLEKRLLDFRCVDSSIFQFAGSSWMTTSPQVVPGHAPITWLLRADDIMGPWRFEPGGLVASDVRIARGAGAVFADGGRLIRPSQDCSVSYGYALVLNEILSLAGAPYRERTICRVDPGWLPQLEGVHSYSRVGNWEAIDGGFAR
jgi:asparagine synthase (glutamine-hydrolysing)